MAAHSRILPTWSESPRSESLPHAEAAEDRRITGPPGDDDLGAGLESLDKGGGSHLRDQRATGIDDGGRERGRTGKGLDPARFERVPQIVLFLVRMDDGELEMMAPLAGDLVENLQGPGNVRTRPGQAGAADDQGYPLGLGPRSA